MKKKSFTAPFWCLLVLGILQLLLAYYYLSTMLRLSQEYGDPHAYRPNLWRIFMWPAIILVEAFVYWLIRWRNSYRMLSWAHVGILIFAFFASILLAVYRIPSYHLYSDPIARVAGPAAAQLPNCLFWVFVDIAHCFFAWLIVNCFRKKTPVMGEGESGENLPDRIID